MSDQVVLGSAFFTNYFAQFEYDVDLDTNKVRLTLAKEVVPGTYLGEQTGSVPGVPIPTPTPVVDPAIPSVDPTPYIQNATSPNSETLNILLLSGEVVIFMMLMACMLYLCCNKLACSGKNKQTVGEYNALQ